ncbi:DoxX family protein [Pseudonocardia sp. C8]|uniref:DoxX family protein n=1 Tax=Pseudonocardia sp. C8 TaxID=2762759 RepID=UPI001642BD4D|nr:DoxX family protein [Pseudonocardia sp. C8]MBC3191035.1 DoxX family protein [Pseudonocardia sp. C8]
MSITATVVVLVTAAWVGFSAYAVYTRQAWVVDNLADYGVPRSWWVWLGSAKALGAAGLVVGLWIPGIGVAAATGLALYFVGAVLTVLRARAFSHVPFPLLYLAPVVLAGIVTAGA